MSESIALYGGIVVAGGPAPVEPRETKPDRLLSRAKVAKLVDVDPLTITRWANAGKLTAERTPGGHRRYRESEVRALAKARKARKKARASR